MVPASELGDEAVSPFPLCDLRRWETTLHLDRQWDRMGAPPRLPCHGKVPLPGSGPGSVPIRDRSDWLPWST